MNIMVKLKIFIFFFCMWGGKINIIMVIIRGDKIFLLIVWIKWLVSIIENVGVIL